MKRTSEAIEVEQTTPAKSQVLEDGTPSRRVGDGADPEMGAFEDEWEDEVDSEEEVNDEDEDAMDVDNVPPTIDEEDEDGPVPEEDVFLPGARELETDEVLEPDQSVYEMLHRMNVNWPCLSFDVLRDNLGDERRSYPATTYLVSGTQADTSTRNELLVMKMSQMHKTQKDDNESDSDDDEDDANALDDDAILEYRSIPHIGGVNRIRAQPLPPGTPLPSPTTPYHVATFSETGKVHIWNVRPHLEALETPAYRFDKNRANMAVHTITAHGKAEGFAVDWSPPATSPAVRLLTGDIHSKIFLTTLTAAGFTTDTRPFTSHTSSVEDIQWSPSEATVFASCSADQSVRVWDVRVKGRKNVVGISKAHDSDVNVLSWNRGTTYLLASGGDEGGIKIWDLRNLKGANAPTPSPVASYNWHSSAITSIEWHPTEDSVFAASGADDQVTLWDLSVEHDEDEAGKDMLTPAGEKLKDVPPQLLFVHQGQKDIKEVHWHPQIPGAVLTTASDGFNVFKTISV